MRTASDDYDPVNSSISLLREPLSRSESPLCRYLVNERPLVWTLSLAPICALISAGG